MVAAAVPGEKLSALELLRRENELLRQTLDVANVPVDAVVQPSRSSAPTATVPRPSGGPAVPAARLTVGSGREVQLVGATSVPERPEDYWSPCIEVPDNMEYVDEYGPISPIPNHDGTMSFKYDNTLWSAAEHFKVQAWAMPHNTVCRAAAEGLRLHRRVLLCHTERQRSVDLASNSATDGPSRSTDGTCSRTSAAPLTTTRVASRSSRRVSAVFEVLQG